MNASCLTKFTLTIWKGKIQTAFLRFCLYFKHYWKRAKEVYGNKSRTGGQSAYFLRSVSYESWLENTVSVVIFARFFSRIQINVMKQLNELGIYRFFSVTSLLLLYCTENHAPSILAESTSLIRHCPLTRAGQRKQQLIVTGKMTHVDFTTAYSLVGCVANLGRFNKNKTYSLVVQILTRLLTYCNLLTRSLVQCKYSL